MGIDSCANSSALIVTEHENKRHFQNLYRVFERSEDGFGNNLARIANHEQVAEANVEDDLCRKSAVGATKQCGERLLDFSYRFTAVNVLTRVSRFPRNEMTVSFE
jgi:hypothetical protein